MVVVVGGLSLTWGLGAQTIVPIQDLKGFNEQKKQESMQGRCGQRDKADMFSPLS